MSDFGFKRIFGNRTNTNFLKIVLQIFIKLEEPITEILFDNTVKTPEFEDYRGAIFDVYCIDKKERNFIVEMQRSELSKFMGAGQIFNF